MCDVPLGPRLATELKMVQVTEFVDCLHHVFMVEVIGEYQDRDVGTRLHKEGPATV